MLARDIMVRNVLKVSQEALVRDVIHIFTQHRISGVPVVTDRNQVVGIITDGDIMARIRTNRTQVIDALTTIFVLADMVALEDKARSLLDLGVREVMSRRVITVNEDTDVGSVAAIMTQRRIKKVPVVRTDRILVGIISRGDVIRAISGSLLES